MRRCGGAMSTGTELRPCAWPAALVVVALFVGGCSESNRTQPMQTDNASSPLVTSVRQGVSPFIAFADVQSPGLSSLAVAYYLIVPKPVSTARPVLVSYARSWLEQRGYFDGNTITLPVFGLYANHANQVHIFLQFDDGSTRTSTA